MFSQTSARTPLLPPALRRSSADDPTTTTADHLRTTLTDTLRDEQIITTPAVEAAFRTVPRHRFVPAVPLDQAYADQPVYTKTDDHGVQLSAASQPRLVATMPSHLGG